MLKSITDPESHPSLHVVKSLPPSVQQSARDDGSARSAGGGSGGGGSANDYLYMVRAPRRGVAIETARLAREARERADDFEAAGLRPRPIKSVAEIFAAQHHLAAGASAGPGASPMKKPTHLRLTSLNLATGIPPFSIGDSGAAVAAADRKMTLNVAPTAAHSSSMARFAAALKLPSQNGANRAAMPPSSVAFAGLPATADSDDEAEEQARRQDRPAPAVTSAASAAASSLSPRPSARSGPGGGGGGGEAVVVAGAAGSSCCICTTTDFVEPWISECAHICCSECWGEWRTHAAGMNSEQREENALWQPSGLDWMACAQFPFRSVMRVRTRCICSSLSNRFDSAACLSL